MSDRWFPPFTRDFYAQIDDEIGSFGRNLRMCRNCPFFDEDEQYQPECMDCEFGSKD
jgi:hypothetical protein